MVPNHGPATENLSECLITLNQNEEALKLLEKCEYKKDYSANMLRHFLQTKALFNLGSRDQYIEFWLPIIKEDGSLEKVINSYLSDSKKKKKYTTKIYKHKKPIRRVKRNFSQPENSKNLIEQAENYKSENDEDEDDDDSDSDENSSLSFESSPKKQKSSHNRNQIFDENDDFNLSLFLDNETIEQNLQEDTLLFARVSQEIPIQEKSGQFNEKNENIEIDLQTTQTFSISAQNTTLEESKDLLSASENKMEEKNENKNAETKNSIEEKKNSDLDTDVNKLGEIEADSLMKEDISVIPNTRNTKEKIYYDSLLEEIKKNPTPPPKFEVQKKSFLIDALGDERYSDIVVTVIFFFFC